jgi:DNA-binding NarL/FixJ family response regulator
VVIVPAQADEGVEEFRGHPRVLVIDSQVLFADALAGLLAQPPLEAMPTTTPSSDVRELLAEEPPDLVLCDLRAEPVPPLELAAWLRSLDPPPPLILLGEVGDEAALAEAIDADVAGLFTKDADPEELWEGIRAVLAGHRAVGAGVMRHVMARLAGERAAAPPGLALLSPTELDILAMVGAAFPVDKIARARGISPKTVRNHLASIYRKLKLRGRTETMLFAARLGLRHPRA